MDTYEAFIESVKSGDVASVEKMLAENGGLVDAEAGGVPVTLLAFYYGQGDLGRRIAERKADWSLYEAATFGEPDRIAEVASGVDVDAYSSDGFTALGFAAFFGRLEAVRALLAAGADPNRASQNAMGVAPIHSALASKNFEIVELLLKNGADANLASKEGWTPLHYSAHAGDLALTDRLLAHGAKPDLRKNSEGRDAAQMAYVAGADDVAHLIESHYSD